MRAVIVPKQPGTSVRRGAIAAELAIMLPVLCFIMVAALDYSRVFYFAVITTNCARNGAMYQAYPSGSPYNSLSTAALADYQFSTNQPTVTSVSGVDSHGVSYVQVTVTYSFQTIMDYPGIPDNVSVARSVWMPVHP